MSKEPTKTYRVLKPIGHEGSRFEQGELIQLTEARAAAIGDEYVALEPITPATAGENKVGGEAPVKAKRKQTKKGR